MDPFREPPIRTNVPSPEGQPRFRFGDGLMLWGSCFSQEIGALLAKDRFRTLESPFGIVYNPLVMALQIERLLEERPMEADELQFDGELWHSSWHHSAFSGPDRDLVLTRMNALMAEARDFLFASSHLILTWGHTQIFTDRLLGLPVANCHKRPSTDFQETHLRLDDLIPAYLELIGKLGAHCPNLQIIVTISPVRYLRNGITAQSRSKATLHLLAEWMEARGAAYFPSWEIMQDELRDYRYYARDLVHPSHEATEIIYHRFLKAWLAPDEVEILEAVREWGSLEAHRPRFPGTRSHAKLVDTLQTKGIEIMRRWPHKIGLIPGLPRSDGK